MGTVRYTVVDGEVLSELRNGVKRDYVPDPLGSTVALLDSSQNITDTFSYWPYGESAGRTGTTPTPFQYVGSFGYFQDGTARNYVRARYLDKSKGRWIIEDPIGFDGGDLNLYAYCWTAPQNYTDRDGTCVNEPKIGGCEPKALSQCASKCAAERKTVKQCFLYGVVRKGKVTEYLNCCECEKIKNPDKYCCIGKCAQRGPCPPCDSFSFSWVCAKDLWTARHSACKVACTFANIGDKCQPGHCFEEKLKCYKNGKLIK